MYVFCADDTSFNTCHQVEAEPSTKGVYVCLRTGGSMYMSKYTVAYFFLSIGIDVFWLDFD